MRREEVEEAGTLVVLGVLGLPILAWWMLKRLAGQPWPYPRST